MHKRKEQTSWPIFEIKDEVVTLHFEGKIDKILLKNDHTQIIGSDYKTGSKPSATDINEFWDVQPFIYNFVLQKQYPEKATRFVYESTKDNIKSLLTIYFDDHECPIKSSRSRYLRTQKEIMEFLLYYGRKVVQGTFSIRERESGAKPCAYCTFDKICRKNSQRFECSDTDTILQSISGEK